MAILGVELLSAMQREDVHGIRQYHTEIQFQLAVMSTATLKFLEPLEERECENMKRLEEKCVWQNQQLTSLRSPTEKPPADPKKRAVKMTVRYDAVDLQSEKVTGLKLQTIPPRAAVRLLLGYEKLPKLTRETIYGTNLETCGENEVDFVIDDQEEIVYVKDQIKKIKKRVRGETSAPEDEEM